MTRMGRVDAARAIWGGNRSGTCNGGMKRQQSERSTRKVCLTRSWATATSDGSLLEGSRALARGPTLAHQPELVSDRKWTSLALQISEALGDRSLHRQRPKPFPERLWTEVRSAAGSEDDPEAVISPIHLSHAGTTISLCVSGAPEGAPHRRPELESSG